jgi:hypothetical protein
MLRNGGCHKQLRVSPSRLILRLWTLSLRGRHAGTKMQVDPRSKSPSYSGVDLCTASSTERAVRTTWPWGHLHSHFSLMKRLDPVVEKGPQNFLGYQSILQQSLNDLPPGLQAMEVYLHRTLSWNEKWDGYP